MIGLDSSPAMLAQARTRADDAGVELELREADLRDPHLEESAALIYCPFRALLHLPTWADRRRAVERVATSLRPDGRFAWNAFDHHIAAGLDGVHRDVPERRRRPRTLEALYGGVAREPFSDDSREYVFVARQSPIR